MSVLEDHNDLIDLKAERALGLVEGLDRVAGYMADLKALGYAYVGVAVTEIASLRAELSARRSGDCEAARDQRAQTRKLTKVKKALRRPDRRHSVRERGNRGGLFESTPPRDYAGCPSTSANGLDALLSIGADGTLLHPPTAQPRGAEPALHRLAPALGLHPPHD